MSTVIILTLLLLGAWCVLRGVWKLLKMFWAWWCKAADKLMSLLRMRKDEPEEVVEVEAVAPSVEELDRSEEPETITLEEVARIAEIAVLRHMVNYLSIEAPSAPVAEEEEEVEEEPEEVEEESEEEEDGMSDCLKRAIARAEEAEREAQEQEDIEYLEGYLSQLEKRLNVLLLRKDRLLALGTKESSRSWRGNEYDINYTKREIANSKNELRKIKVGF